jgi:hypothetical protein
MVNRVAPRFSAAHLAAKSAPNQSQSERIPEETRGLLDTSPWPTERWPKKAKPRKSGEQEVLEWVG